MTSNPRAMASNPAITFHPDPIFPQQKGALLTMADEKHRLEVILSAWVWLVRSPSHRGPASKPLADDLETLRPDLQIFASLRVPRLRVRRGWLVRPGDPGFGSRRKT